MLIAVTGATGWIGSYVVRELSKQGFVVRRLIRRPICEEDRHFDLSRPSKDWTGHLEGCEAIIHCAAMVHVLEECGRGNESEFRLINSEATARLIEAATSAGVRRFVLASTIAVYNWKQIQPLVEHDSTEPESAYARSKLEAEKWVRKSELDWRICRLATVFGTGDRANFARLALALKRGRFIIPGKGSARKSVVTVDMVASVLARAAWDTGWSRKVMNVAFPEAPSLNEICTAFTDICGLPASKHVPMGVMKSAALMGTMLAKFGINAPLTSGTLQKLTTDTVVSTNMLAQYYPGRLWPDFSDALASHSSYYQKL
jgi:nucleoside-diphosphate-sugar epimerase